MVSLDSKLRELRYIVTSQLQSDAMFTVHPDMDLFLLYRSNYGKSTNVKTYYILLSYS